MDPTFSIVAENGTNNRNICALLCERAKPLPPPFQAMFTRFSMSAYCFIEELIDRDPNLPPIISVKVGKLNASQFSALYHVTIWSLVALYTNITGFDKELIRQACEIFANPLDEEIPFSVSVRKAFDIGDANILALNLHKEFRRILGLPRADDPGFIAFTVLFVSGLQAAESEIG